MTNRGAFLPVLLLFCCVAGRPVEAQSPTGCDVSALPAAAQKLLAMQFSEWRPKVLSDMGADNQQLWLSATKGKECPGVATGHFETREKLSYALLLVPKSNSNTGYKVIVLSYRAADDSY